MSAQVATHEDFNRDSWELPPNFYDSDSLTIKIDNPVAQIHCASRHERIVAGIYHATVLGLAAVASIGLGFLSGLGTHTLMHRDMYRPIIVVQQSEPNIVVTPLSASHCP